MEARKHFKNLLERQANADRENAKLSAPVLLFMLTVIIFRGRWYNDLLHTQEICFSCL